jgi:NADH-quinone oxidoreductase subunit K
MLENTLVLILLIFFLGIVGVAINRHNIIIVLLSFELIYLSSNLVFAFTSFFTGNLLGLFYIIYVLTVVGAEACIGLSIVLLYYSINSQLSLNTLNLTKL